MPEFYIIVKIVRSGFTDKYSFVEGESLYTLYVERAYQFVSEVEAQIHIREKLTVRPGENTTFSIWRIQVL